MATKASLKSEAFPNRISTWVELAQLVEHFSYFSGHDWLFRGVTDSDHQLTPKIGREKARGFKELPTGKRVRHQYEAKDERAVLAMFKQQARPHLVSSPQTEIEWLAIAQHYGLPTRLLDWTDSLFVATWFAVERAGAKETDSAIWVTRGVPAISERYFDKPLQVGQAQSYRPPHISPRIAAQGSVFVVCPKPTASLVLQFVRKIVIDRSIEMTLKKRLNACGMNRRHLFPDLAGLGEHLAWMYKNNWLAGYQEDMSFFPTSAAVNNPTSTP